MYTKQKDVDNVHECCDKLCTLNTNTQGKMYTKYKYLYNTNKQTLYNHYNWQHGLHLHSAEHGVKIPTSLGLS